MVAWALVDRSVWALAAGGIAVALTKTVMSHFVLPGPANRLTWDAAAAREVFGFGKWIFLSTVLTFLVGQSDRLVFGKLIPLELLGVYSIAVMVATMPTMALGHAALSLVFPIYSRVRNAGGDLVPLFRRVRQAMLVPGGWMLAGLVAGGPAIVALLYDPRYADAGWIVRFLSMGAWFYMLEATNGAALLALGRADRVAASNGGKLAGMIVLIPLGYLWGGFPGAVLGFAASEVLKYAVSAHAAARAGLPGRRQDLVLTAAVAGSAAAGGFAAHAARGAGHPALLQAALVFAVVTAIWIPFGVDLLRRYRRTSPEAAP
jgi:O-antigen/teichoic acid export membrane protein